MTIRRFKNSDAPDVSKLVAKTLMVSNSQDYSKSYLVSDIKERTPEFFIESAKLRHCYVVSNDTNGEIIGTGSIGSYWEKDNESSLFNIFVDPEFQGQGIGTRIINTLEADGYFAKANRIEIPASITGLDFYLKMGYHFKNGNDTLDNEGLYRLEKFNNKKS